MMFSVITLIACVCLGSAMGQMCFPVSYTADSFNIESFQMFRVLHNSEKQLSFYKSTTDGRRRLFDDASEDLYEIYDDGTCLKYNNTRNHADPAAVAAFMMSVRPEFEIAGPFGEDLVGYNIDGGFLKIRLLLSKTSCRIVHVSVNSGGKQLLLALNTGHEDIKDSERQEIDDALKEFKKLDCPVITL